MFDRGHHWGGGGGGGGGRGGGGGGGGVTNIFSLKYAHAPIKIEHRYNQRLST
jgi:hypothetical protein